MIAAFGSTYGAIDIRTATLKQKGAWTNAYTVIRLTYEDVNETRRRLRELEARNGPVKTDSFQILFDCRPFSAWKELCTELAADKLSIGDMQVSFQQPVWINLSRTMAYLQEDYGAIRPFDSQSWPVAQFLINAYGTPALPSEGLVAETTKLGSGARRDQTTSRTSVANERRAHPRTRSSKIYALEAQTAGCSPGLGQWPFGHGQWLRYVARSEG